MPSESSVDDSTELRGRVIATARAMNAAGINVNTSGNVSARCARGARYGFVITPSALAYDKLTAEDLVFVDDAQAAIGAHQPSSEWRFHFSIYAARADARAIVHTHSPHATALACQHLDIPSFHYMVAVAGGSDIRCAPYATFGTQELADYALAALENRRACLLAHHGVIACGADVESALALAVEVENLARTYIAVRALGPPKLLTADQMAHVLERFQTYWRPAAG